MKLLSTLKRAFREPIYAMAEPKIEIYGKSELVMTGCTHIDELEPGKAVLSCRDASLFVEGAHLELVLLSQKTVAIRGRLDMIKLSDRQAT